MFRFRQEKIKWRTEGGEKCLAASVNLIDSGGYSKLNKPESMFSNFFISNDKNIGIDTIQATQQINTNKHHPFFCTTSFPLKALRKSEGISLKKK